MHSASVVNSGGAKIVQLHDHGFAFGYRDVSIRREPRNTIVPRRGRGGVVDIHIAIDRKVWIKRDAEQATFAGWVHVERGEGRGQQSAIFYDAQPATLFAHKYPPIRGYRHRGWLAQSGRNYSLGESRRQDCGSRGANQREQAKQQKMKPSTHC